MSHPDYIISKQGENYNLLKWSRETQNEYIPVISNKDLAAFLQSKEFHNEMLHFKSDSEIIDVNHELDNKEKEKIWQMLRWYIKKKFKYE